MHEWIGFLITGLGLLVGFLSEFGAFSNKKKIKFFDRIFKTQQAIPRDGEIFEEFVKRFPPALSDANVTRIMPRRLDASNDGRDCFSSVFYEENGLPGSRAVATESEVKEWAYKTSATKFGLGIAAVGLVAQVVGYFSV